MKRPKTKRKARSNRGKKPSHACQSEEEQQQRPAEEALEYWGDNPFELSDGTLNETDEHGNSTKHDK